MIIDNLQDNEKQNQKAEVRVKFACLIGEIAGRGYIRVQQSDDLLNNLKLFTGNLMDDEIDAYFHNYIFGKEQAYPWAINSLFASLESLIIGDSWDNDASWTGQLRAEFKYGKEGIERENEWRKNRNKTIL